MSDLDATYSALAAGSATEPPPRWFWGRLQHLALEATRSEEPSARLGALRVAAALGVERCLAITRELLRDEDPAIRGYAFNQAVAARSAGVGLLRQVAEGPDTALAAEALRLLTVVADRGAIHLARRLLRSEDTAVVVAALALVGRVGGSSVGPELGRMKDHPVEAVRVAVIGTLERLESGTSEPPGQWWDDTSAFHLPAPPVDGRPVTTPQVPPPPPEEPPATEAPVAPSDSAALVPVGGAPSESPAPETPLGEGCALPAALPTEARALLRLLGMVAPGDRGAVVNALRPLTRDVADLLARYRPGGDEALGRGLAHAAGALGTPGWLTRVRPLLAAPQARVRAATLAVYAAHGSSAAIPLLVAALQDPEAPVRVAAVRAVATVCARTVQQRLGRDRLGPLGQDPDPTVRAAAQDALQALQ